MRILDRFLKSSGQVVETASVVSDARGIGRQGDINRCAAQVDAGERIVEHGQVVHQRFDAGFVPVVPGVGHFRHGDPVIASGNDFGNLEWKPLSQTVRLALGTSSDLDHHPSVTKYETAAIPGEPFWCFSQQRPERRRNGGPEVDAITVGFGGHRYIPCHTTQVPYPRNQPRPYPRERASVHNAATSQDAHHRSRIRQQTVSPLLGQLRRRRWHRLGRMSDLVGAGASERRQRACDAALGVAAGLGIRAVEGVVLADWNNTIVWLAPAPIVAKVGNQPLP